LLSCQWPMRFDFECVARIGTRRLGVGSSFTVPLRNKTGLFYNDRRRCGPFPQRKDEATFPVADCQAVAALQVLFKVGVMGEPPEGRLRKHEKTSAPVPQAQANLPEHPR